MRIVVLDGRAVNPEDLTWSCLNEFGEVIAYNEDECTQTLSRLQGADIAVINKTLLRAETLRQLPQLRLIAVLATGYNTVDVAAATELGITVCNIPSYSTDSVAQGLFAHLLNITNHVQHYVEENRRGRWSSCPDFCYRDFPLHELAGQHFGIIGMGHIGTKVATIANAFGMKVLAATHRPQSDLEPFVEKVTQDELFALSDIITLHCPLTRENRHFINAEAIAKMRHGVILLNMGRGALINEDDVAAALRSGHIAAYGADVLSKEPPTADNPILSAPNAYLTPHNIWTTFEARQRLLGILCDNVRSFLAGNPINVVKA